MADNIYSDGSAFYTPGTTGNDVLVALTGGTQLDAGAGRDNLNGSSGNDVLTGGKGDDFMWGGAGDDTFLWHSADLGTDGTTVDRVYDFEGAGNIHGDNLVFYGFGVGSSLTVAGTQSLAGGAVIYKYILNDTATGHSETLYVTSVNGAALTTDDYHFYSSVPASI
ncbi:hypothetical protein EDF56_105337 [Novosphingobium sp. PhB165]|uniref:calcium-binding protein n=1 Tax=Novosphingobium sp. PhB165 TaxID=2485105 RepID=UPI00104CCBCD|nr:hypothetical protein [Novosphingobium sp. PhB165]TCM17989.1 hypothetical protein EDF56_105337 [Novosphingobium sp. PhB165]